MATDASEMKSNHVIKSKWQPYYSYANICVLMWLCVVVDTLYMFHHCICSLKSMFDSLQFKENLTSFQQLLAEGVFDLSFQGASTENCKTLKRLSLSNLTTSKWVEHYNLLKVWIKLLKYGYYHIEIYNVFDSFLQLIGKCFGINYLLWLQKCKSNAGASIVASGPNAVASNNVSNFKRSRDSQNQKFPG